MDVPVILQTVEGYGYRATGAGGLSIGLIADGATAAEAIDRLTEQLRTRLHAGATLTEVRLDDQERPWLQDAGCLRDEPLYDRWREAMEANRRALDEDPESLQRFRFIES